MQMGKCAKLASSRAVWVVASLVVALALQSALATNAFAAQEELAVSKLIGSVQTQAVPQTQAEITDEGNATVTTDGSGNAYLKLVVSSAGVYSIGTTASTGVDCDTIGYLYDSSMKELYESDDRHADTNFTICENLSAGTYYLRVTGKECQANASITVAVAKGQALNALDVKCAYASDDSVSAFELGTWVHGSTTTWSPVPASAFNAVGYVDRSVFVHAQESGAVSMLAWKNGLPSERGRFVVMVEAVDDSYLGSAYYNLDDKVDASSIAELDPKVSTTVCNAISSVELGKYTTVPTNWSTRWDAITAGYYEVVGYCERSRFETLGGDEASVSWKKGLPRDEGSYVIKCAATKASGNPYTGSCYVWTSIEGLAHAGSGSWIVDKKATYSSAGQRHLKCAYCGAACDYTTIPALKASVETAGKGATLADYKVLSANTVSYVKCLSTGTKAEVPAKVSIDGASYKVVSVAAKAFSGKSSLKSVVVGTNTTSIGSTAFKGCKQLSTLTVKTTKLTKAGVKNCLKSSSVTIVKAPKSKKAAYKALFVKGVCGKNVTVR